MGCAPSSHRQPQSMRSAFELCAHSSQSLPVSLTQAVYQTHLMSSIPTILPAFVLTASCNFCLKKLQPTNTLLSRLSPAIDAIDSMGSQHWRSLADALAASYNRRTSFLISLIISLINIMLIIISITINMFCSSVSLANGNEDRRHTSKRNS